MDGASPLFATQEHEMATPTDEMKNEWREIYGAMSLKQQAIEFKLLQQQYADAKETAANIYHIFDFLRKQIIPATMDEQGFTTVKIEGVGRIQIGFQTSAKQLDKEALFQWLRDNGHPEIVAETVNSSTLASFLKAQLADGESIPDENIVDFSTYEVASVVKA
jgi:hypothetical protein